MKLMTDREALRRIAANVRARRIERGISQRELAAAINEYHTAIARLELGQSMPRIGILTRIAEALQCTVNDLLAVSSPSHAH